MSADKFRGDTPSGLGIFQNHEETGGTRVTFPWRLGEFTEAR